MKDFKYILEPYDGMATRYHCPNPDCNQKTFVRYIDIESNDYLAENVGRCNRQDKCGYHFTPKEYFALKGQNNYSISYNQHSNLSNFLKQKEISFINPEVMRQSLNSYSNNNFTKFLEKLVGYSMTRDAIERYYIGTSSHWEHSTIFWQIDRNAKIRTGKIMLYNSETGRRVKKPYNHIGWVHSQYRKEDYNLKQCFFGEHLLKSCESNVGIVESEKTAIIASVYMPDFIWLAVGSSANLNAERCEILRNRKVIVYPDINSFDSWNNKVQGFKHIADFTVSSILEKYSGEEAKKESFDLADYLIQYDWRVFRGFSSNLP